MEAGPEFDPSKIENIFQDFKCRRAGLIKALTTDVEEFFRQCDPEKEYLCLYGLPNETWKVSLPAKEVPPEIPEPVLGINFNSDRMSKKEWLRLVAAHSDSWLHSVAFYYVSLVARSSEVISDRARLFSMINDLPTVSETVLGSFEKPSKEKSSATTHKSDTSKSPSGSKRGSESDIRASRGRSTRGGRCGRARTHKGLQIMEAGPEYDPSRVEKIFQEFNGHRAGLIKALTTGHEFDPSKIENIFQVSKGRRAGLIKALTTDVEEFFRQCDPEKENLCLYGLPNETWKVSLPAAEVPPEIPEPVLGINSNRDRMSKKEWLTLVAHSDSWLHSVAFYYVSLVARSSAGISDRARLFSMINELPTVSETVLGSFEKPSKEKSSATTHKSDTSKSPSGSKRGSESDIRASRGRSGRGGRIHKGLRIMEKVPEYDPGEIFKDFKGSRAGMIKALTTEVDEFFQQCDPEKDNLCLYGYPDETWGVSVPFQDAPPEIPEPVSGINFARDLMSKMDWLNFVAFHCDSWLHYVAFYTAAKFGLGKTDRARLFRMTNDLPTICETLAKSFEKQINDNSSAAEHGSNTSKSPSGSKTGSKSDIRVKFSKLAEIVEVVEEEGIDDNPMCGICKENNHSGYEFWICCDMCGNWFHGKCVKITQSRAARLKKYKCPYCCEGPSQ